MNAKIIVFISLCTFAIMQSTLAAKKDSCVLPVESGRCRMYLERYAYNPDTNDCEMFVFGGCTKNANHFMTYKDCLAACKDMPFLSFDGAT
ncbi:kappaPI-actitoxin-Avd3c-like isoform X2 [Belonocnema kinseyi]|uniref:kappaPI-actitoxin-Avd3c-like isoform X2 n=1 Tax=Belonocnema kinseyi TaxID=2817044 RepID=UPI00143DA84A|nr:kappaPI-actitoxin-Avd3c-like isoform X2 [Belonocnema kinseyi]